MAARLLRPRRAGAGRGGRRYAPALNAVRSALEEALGVRFEGDKGARFFRIRRWCRRCSTASSPPGCCGRGRRLRRPVRFNWHDAVWHLRVPVLRALFVQLSRSRPPATARPRGGAGLDRRRARPSGPTRLLRPLSAEGEAVPYFYEPFLEAFDPQLRKQLGVWYTPTEVVRYMVARVDRALKDDLDIPEGLAAENVYVLDPCCGTGAFLAEVLRRIATNLEGQGLGALAGARVKQAATTRVFGFEIMPAPFVVAHLQVGLTMQDLDAPLADDGEERAGVFLTNALTGWEPTAQGKATGCLSRKWRQERDRAERM